MRDIRNDIQERLDALAEELFRLEARLGRLQQLEEGFRTILVEEETHWPQQESLLSGNGQELAEGFGNILAEEETDLPQQEPLFSANAQPKARGRAVQSYSALGKFIFTTLNDGQVWSIDDLTKLGIKAGVLVGKSDPKKVMEKGNFSVSHQLGLQNNIEI